MRILFVNDYTESVGGVEVYDEQLMALLREHGNVVELVGGGRPENGYRRYLRSLYSPRFRRTILETVDRFEPDIVFAHSICYNVSPSFLPPLSRRGIPIVLTVPELAQLSYQFPNLPAYFVPASFVRKFIQRRFLKRYVDVFIAPSNVAAEHVRSVFGTDDVVRIPHPAFWEIETDDLERDDGRILFVGRLDHNKGVTTLLRAFEKVLTTGKEDAVLEIVGEGPAREDLEALARDMHVDHRVEFRGRIAHEDVRERYREAAMFVLPSDIAENCPMTIIEALSQGTPVVTTDLGGQRELVDEECGILVEPGDPDGLASAISGLLSNPDRRAAMSAAARRHASTFSTEEHVRRLEALFERLIEGRSVRGLGDEQLTS